MTHVRMVLPMGLAMGAMVPVMIHGPLAAAGMVLLAGHVFVLGGALLASFLFKPVRRMVAAHRPDRAALGRICLGAATGFAIICAHCLWTWHGGGA